MRLEDGTVRVRWRVKYVSFVRLAMEPKLFGRAAVIVDFGGLAQLPDPATAGALIDGLRDAGVLPVALAYGSRDNDALAQALDLPVLAKFRAQYERAEAPPAEMIPHHARVQP